mgnify:CR=1 FL=1
MDILRDSREAISVESVAANNGVRIGVLIGKPHFHATLQKRMVKVYTLLPRVQTRAFGDWRDFPESEYEDDRADEIWFEESLKVINRIDDCIEELQRIRTEICTRIS